MRRNLRRFGKDFLEFSLVVSMFVVPTAIWVATVVIVGGILSGFIGLVLALLSAFCFGWTIKEVF